MRRRNPALSVPVAGALALMCVLNTSARAADCLVAPREAAPEGQHWFYRTDQATKQKCWYLRERDVETTGSPQVQQSARSDAASNAADQPAASPPLGKSEQEALFKDFLRWQKQRGGTQ